MIHIKKRLPHVYGTLRNLLILLTQFGFKINRSSNEHKYISDLQKILSNNSLSSDEFRSLLDPKFASAYREHVVFLNALIENLQKTLDPSNYGIARNWRKTQKEALQSLIKGFSSGLTRPVFEIPTGGGKSMVFGALARAFYDTFQQFNFSQEIVIMTSRVNIIDQFVTTLYQEENLDEPIKIGDIKLWFPEFNDNDFRILAGDTSSDNNEIQKKSKITFITYQGLSPQKLTKIFNRKPFCFLLDECHRVTERVSMVLNNHPAWFVGGSATVVGAQHRSPFVFFEPFVKTIQELQEAKTFKELFTFYKSVSEMIQQKESKPIRWIDVKTKIDISNTSVTNGKYALQTIFNESSLSQVISSYADVAFEVLNELFLSLYPPLQISNSLQPHNLLCMVFVSRVAMAQYLVERCNNELSLEITKKFGKEITFNSSYVDGKMKSDEFNTRMKNFREGKITIMFSSEKLGEGSDIPGVNMIIMLRALGLGSQWKLKQFIGRGSRINPVRLDDDLLVIDSVFQSSRHNLASVFGILGETRAYSGGLIVGHAMLHVVERKIFDLLSQKIAPIDILKFFTGTQKEIAEKILKVSLLSKYSSESDLHTLRTFHLQSIDLIERDDIRFHILLNDSKELAIYAYETLKKLGYTSRRHLVMIRDSLLIAFSRNSAGKFGRGIDLVNTVLSTSYRSLTSLIFDTFISHLEQYVDLDNFENLSFSDVVNLSTAEVVIETSSIEEDVVGEAQEVLIGNPINDLVQLCQNKFGLEPDIHTHNRISEDGITRYVSQAYIKTGFYSNDSGTVTAIKKTLSRKKAALALHKKIESDIEKNILNFYFGSNEFNLRQAAVMKFALDNGTQITYTTELGHGNIYECVAMLKKHKHTFLSKKVKHQNLKKVKLFANLSLFNELERNTEITDSLKRIEGSYSETLLDDICLFKKWTIESFIEKKQGLQNYELYTCRVILRTDLGTITSDKIRALFQENAREKACESMLKKIEILTQNSIESMSKITQIDLNKEHPYLVHLNKYKSKYNLLYKRHISKHLDNFKLSLVVIGKKPGFECRSAEYHSETKGEAMNYAAKELLPQIIEYLQ